MPSSYKNLSNHLLIVVFLYEKIYKKRESLYFMDIRTGKLLEIRKLSKKANRAKNTLLLVGFPGIGNVSKIVSSYVIESKKMDLQYEIYSDGFPFLVLIDSKESIHPVSWSIYGTKLNHKIYDYFYVLTGNFLIDDPFALNLIVRNLVSFFKKELKVNYVISVAGIATESPSENIYVISNDRKETQRIKKKLGINTTLHNFVSYISGMNGAFLATPLKTTCFLTESYSLPYYQGIKEARNILKAIDSVYELKISTKEIEEDIKKIEEEIQKLSKSAQQKVDKTINYIG